MKEQSIWLYQTLTRPTRAKTLRTLKECGNVPVAILFYHRIADTTPNGWTMSRRDFARQLDWLQTNFNVVSLADAQRIVQSGTNEQQTVAITFDDGYADNADFAIPELVARGLPATYFVATDFVKHGKCFPHDIAAGQPLAPNSIDEIRQFASQGIEIGAHTRSHCDLGSIQDPDQALDEIQGSVRALENWIDAPLRYFAFPFGLPDKMSQLAVDIVRDLGLDGFCSAYGAWNWPGDDGFHLRRIHADPGLARLKNWLTYDSRKLVDRTELPFTERDDVHAAATHVLPLGTH